MRNLGSPAHSRAWFETLLMRLGERARCHRVLLDGDTIGGLISIRVGRLTTVPWASCERRHFARCPNNILYWHTFDDARQHGAERFDFGRSSPGSGTYRFKKQWSAEERPLWWQVLGPETSLEPLENGSSPPIRAASGGRLRGQLERVWRCLPVPLATWLGARIRGDITL
jgi:CelD/BcsL family acetyltransferase involved in cellulose biosynthesis